MGDKTLYAYGWDWAEDRPRSYLEFVLLEADEAELFKTALFDLTDKAIERDLNVDAGSPFWINTATIQPRDGMGPAIDAIVAAIGLDEEDE